MPCAAAWAPRAVRESVVTGSSWTSFGLLNFHFTYFSDWVSGQQRSHLREAMTALLGKSSHSEQQARCFSSIVLAL